MRPGPRKVSQRARRARRVKGPGFASGPRGPALRAALDPAARAGPRRSHLPRAGAWSTTDKGHTALGPHDRRSRHGHPRQPRRADRELLPRARSTTAPRHLRQDGRPGRRDRPGRVRHRLGAAARAPGHRPRALRGVLVAVQGRAARGVGARAPPASRAAGRRPQWRRRGQPRAGRPRQRRRRTSWQSASSTPACARCSEGCTGASAASWLLFAYGLSYEEIATVTGTSYTAVNRWMARGRNALRAADARRHLSDDDPDGPAR